MKRTTKFVAFGASAALLGAVPVAVAGSASADPERKGSCSLSRTSYDFEVDKEHGRYEASFELDSDKRGQEWRVKLFHDGKRVFRDVRTTDNEGEIEFERLRPNNAGKDHFRAKARNLGSGELCMVRIVRA